MVRLKPKPVSSLGLVPPWLKLPSSSLDLWGSVPLGPLVNIKKNNSRAYILLFYITCLLNRSNNFKVPSIKV